MNKLITYALSTFLLFFCFTTKAQNLTLGIRSGISIPNLIAGGSNQNPLNTGYSSILGPDAGIFVEYKISTLFSLQPMIEYSSQGGKKNGMQAFPTPPALASMFPPGSAPQYLYANYSSKAKMNYLMIPVLAKFGWNIKSSPLRIYADAGPFISFLLSAKQITSGESQIYADSEGKQPLPGGPQSFNNNTDIANQLHKTNVGIEGNIGLSYHFGLNNIFIEGGGNYGFIGIQKGTQNGKNNTGAGTVVIGYSYGFNK